MAFLLISSRFGLAVLFLAAGVAKLGRRRQFARAIERFELLPRAWTRTVADWLPRAEITLASLLGFGILIRPTTLLLAVLLSAFIGAIVVNLVRGRRIDRVKKSWVATNGLSRYPGGTSYIYLTRQHQFRESLDSGLQELLPGGQSLPVCSGFPSSLPPPPANPFYQSSPSGEFLDCFSSKSPSNDPNFHFYTGQGVGSLVDGQFPILLAAIDPAQENRLIDLDRTIVSGRGLKQADKVEFPFGVNAPFFPVIASSRTYVDESLKVDIERLRFPPGTNVQQVLASERAYRFLTSLRGDVVGNESLSPSVMYGSLLEQLSDPKAQRFIGSFWRPGPVSYSVRNAEQVQAVPTSNPSSVWRSRPGDIEGVDFLPAPPGNQDVQFRRLQEHLRNRGLAGVRIVGRFDPAKLPGFSPLTQVPLESYYPPEADPADDASKAALGGRPLFPTMNLGDYISQPPFMLTTIQAAGRFLDPKLFQGASSKAPISVIRVKVAGVTGPDPVSRERVRRVAQAIIRDTRLTVDITAGSSLRSLVVRVPAGKFGRPSLLVSEGWTKKGVAFAIISAIDRKSLALFFLILVVAALFLGNGALASVRSRRREIGTLLCLGWSRREIFQGVLGELGLIGLVSGVLGAGMAALAVRALSLNISLGRTLFVVPVAVALTMAAGVLPAWRATELEPLDAVRPPVADSRTSGHIERIPGMAVSNLRRLPGRTLLAATALLVGVAALAFLLAVILAFRGTVVGTLLGQVVSVQVRGVDILSVALAVVLGALSVADVLFLNLRERAPELVTLRAAGWTEGELGRLVAMEGIGVAALGGVLGGALGLVLGLIVGGPPALLTLAAALAALAGVVVSAMATLIPAVLIGRLTPPAVLAEE